MTRPTAFAGSARSARPTEFELHSGRGWLSAERALVQRVNRNDANGYYKALGLKPDATRDEIKAAYRKMAKAHHPDLGGDEELFMFITQIADVLLDPEKKNDYDSTSGNSVYLGNIEREELARNGIIDLGDKPEPQVNSDSHWACLTDVGCKPGEDTDAWIDLCWQVSPAVGYRGKIRVGVIEGGPKWPCSPDYQWGVLSAGNATFTLFQKGVEPNRLHALCAMIELKKQRATAQDGKRTT